MPAPQGRRQLLSAAAGAALLAASALQAPDAQAVIKVRRLGSASVGMQGWCVCTCGTRLDRPADACDWLLPLCERYGPIPVQGYEPMPMLEGKDYGKSRMT